MILWLTLACDAPLDGPGGVADSLDVTLAAAPAFDPLAGATFTWVLSGADAEADAQGSILAENGDVVRSHVAREAGWDGKDDAGALVATGAYELVVGTGEAERTAGFELVRVGLTEAYAEDDGGVTATRVPLYWNMKRHAQDPTLPFASVDTIDDASGHVTPLPEIGESLVVPGTNTAEPVAYPYDSRPLLTLTLGSTSSLGATHLGDVELHLALPGWTVVSDGPLAAGATVTLQKDEPLGTTLGVTEETLALTVSATDSAGTDWPVATMNVPWRVYRLLDAPTWGDNEGDKYQPWVAAIDPALRALEGVAPDRKLVLDALVRWVYQDGGLAYDTTYGASAYTIYSHNDWTEASFDMSGFLARKFGVIVNCTDCAGIIVGFGNMLGAEVDYAIIQENFDLNYILAIGGDEYTRCPFGEGGCGFSYHAVSTSRANDLIWDATLALDGDDDPGSTPNTELLVQSIDADEYLERLVKPSTPASYTYQAQGTLQ